MASMNIFDGPQFSMMSMSRALDKRPYQPSFLGDLRLFTPERLRTKMVTIEEREGVLEVIKTSERGKPPEGRKTRKRNLRAVEAPRIAGADTLFAHEIDGIRAFGSETELMQVQQEVAQRLDGPTGLRRNVELTWEHMRLGAVNGVVLDADGSELFNWYDAFEIAAPETVYFDFANAVPDNAPIHQACQDLVRSAKRDAKGAWVEGRTYLVGLAGDDFYDLLVRSKEVRETYLNQIGAGALRNDVGNAFGEFRYGGIRFKNYQGTDDNSTVAVAPNECRFFPVNAPAAFRVVWTPGEFFGTVNRPGKEIYVLIVRDRERNAWVKLEVYSYPLFMCTRPGMLRKGNAGAAP